MKIICNDCKNKVEQKRINSDLGSKGEAYTLFFCEHCINRRQSNKEFLVSDIAMWATDGVILGLELKRCNMQEVKE